MEYDKEINPFFEATIYFQLRFSSNRMSMRTERLRQNHPNMPEVFSAYFDLITRLEQELDGAIILDEEIKPYFMPIKTRAEHPNPLTVASMLLALPEQSVDSISFDGIVSFIKDSPQDAVFSHFVNMSLYPFLSAPNEHCASLQEFMAIVNDTIVAPEDKWRLIDAATNPLEHLDKLRGVIDEASRLIGKRAGEFSRIIEHCRDRFLAGSDLIASFHTLNIDFNNDEIERVVVYPSVFLLTTLNLTVPDEGKIRVMMGLFINQIIESKRTRNTAESYVSYLKAMSDSTRLKALIEMCGKYSYGQELADKLGGTRNQMYYHLEKLQASGLIDCKVTEYRTLYTMNKKNIYETLTALRDFLVDGWTPESGDEPEELPEE